MPRYLYVDQPDTISSDLMHHEQLGIDTEFMREKTYFAQLCLVQVATGDDIYCVDPLSDSGQQEFWQALLAREWVVHSARQDIEVVYQTTGSMPDSVFDTQIAAGLLGYPAQVGYAGLVKGLFAIDMAKSHTRADWTRRPLREAFLEYAAEDVEYLLPAYEQLGEQLDREGRLDWARQDSRLLLDPQLYDVGANQAIDRLKGARNFQGRKRAAAARLAAWREDEAVRKNRPRQWILRDKVLLEIANNLPASEDQLAAIQGLSPKLVNRAGKALLESVNEPATEQDSYRPPSPLDEEQKALLKEAQARVARCAQELGLAAETVASKRELVALIDSGDQQSRILSGWRRDVIGADLLELM